MIDDSGGFVTTAEPAVDCFTVVADALGYRFSAEADDPDLDQLVRSTMAPLHSEGPSEHRYVLRGRGDAVTLELDGEPIFGPGDSALVVEWLWWHVNQSAAAHAGDRVVLHAGAVRAGDAGIVFPAPGEGGKSTLVAGLVDAGLAYLSDELGVLSNDVSTLLPYPKPIALRPGAQKLFAHWRGDAAVVGERWLVTPRLIGTACRPEIVVATQYVPGARTELTELSPVDALVVLLSNSVCPPDDEGRTARRLSVLAERCRCYRMQTGELGRACEAVLELIGDDDAS